MNEVVKIVHKSRPYEMTLKFAADGETSWIFNSDGDGEIYAIETSNITSYTINGSAVNLPFTLQNGKSYPFSVVKTNKNEVGKVTFKTRRGIEKKVTINVPDFGKMPVDANIYVLLSKTVKVYNCNLLTSANYQGNGTWTTSPLIRSINLPITYNSQDLNWYAINYDDGDMICWGSTFTGAHVTNYHVVCRIKHNGDVYDYYGNTLNEVTPFLTSGWVLYYCIAANTDYVGGNYILKFACYGNQLAALQMFSKADLSQTISNLSVSTYSYKIPYNPHKRRIVDYGDIDLANFYYLNLLLVNNIVSWGAYSHLRAVSVKCNANSYKSFMFYNDLGKVITAYSSNNGDGANANGRPGNPLINQSNHIGISISNNQSSFALNDFGVGELASSHKITSFAETNAGVRHITTDERSNKFFFTPSDYHEDMMIIVDAYEATPEVGFIQETEKIQCISNNNYL